MNNFYKTAYDAGTQQALQDYGITKEAGPIQALRAKAVQALGAAKGLPGKARDYLQNLRPETVAVGQGLAGLTGLGVGGVVGANALRKYMVGQLDMQYDNERDLLEMARENVYRRMEGIPEGELPDIPWYELPAGSNAPDYR